ncbi:MAG: N-acetylmuramoyl-L-alanine amidase [Bacteroidetes bacterium]|nr:N-acetylmuramoyl-L-alanine amidase [Bacteroidota bacterium]
MRSLLIAVLVLLPAVIRGQSAAVLHEEDRETYDAYFEQAGAEFGVPSDILRGISFAETRWTHMKWDENDLRSSCTGMPRVYGVMGLWDNSYFGYSLKDAAALIGRSVQELKESPLQNIRGGAALLRKYFDELPKPEAFESGSIELWQNAVSRFSGFPQAEISAKRGLEVYSVLANGYHRDRISIAQRPVRLEKIQAIVQQLESRTADQKHSSPEGAQSTPDYPLAKWNAAYSGNFGTDQILQRFVVVHDVEGSYLGCISWFKNTTAGVSAHYVLNSNPYGVNSSTKGPNGTPDAPVGEVTQMVEEKYRAWHVGCWNSFMVGIEHEGYASVSGWYTPEGYDASSKLVKYLCDKYNIPKDRNHVIAHSEHTNSVWRNWVNSSGQGFDPTCNTHVDPGPYWTWDSFMTKVSAADTVRPVITAALPLSDLDAFPAYKEIVIEFNTPMDISSTNAAFSISPNISGTKVWSPDNKRLTFDPAALLPWSTLFSVKIDTSAKNVARSRNLGTVPFMRSFTVVPKDSVGPAVISMYPLSNETGVSTLTDVVFNLTEPVQTISLSTTLKMVDENNANVPMSGAKNETVLDKGVIYFSPANLKPNRTYTVKLLAGMKDTYNNVTKSDLIVQFTTSPTTYTPGIVIDKLDGNTRGWKQPKQSEKSVSIDTVKTSLLFVSEKYRGGTGAAKLSYQFSAPSGGLIELQCSGMPAIDGASTFGLWVFGDASNNSLQLNFAPNDQSVNVGNIFWRGWKFIQYPLSMILGTNRMLSSIIVQQSDGYDSESKLYFDEFQTDAGVLSVGQSEDLLATEYSLSQNYPNPFNPSTDISYTVATTGHVLITVYDVLGREAAVVVNELQPAGRYNAQFDASRLSSGMYFYTMRTNSFSKTKKMILTK